MEWSNSTSDLALRVMAKAEQIRQGYRHDHMRIVTDHVIVSSISQGDYRARQIYELVQNGADAIGADSTEKVDGGKVKIVLTKDGLYCGNQGAPFSFEGIEAIAYPIHSAKTGNEIGRYGQGFRSVLAVTDQLGIYSRTISCHYSFELASRFLTEDKASETDKGPQVLIEELGTNESPSVNILAIPVPVDPDESFNADPILKEMSLWAATIIHLPFIDSQRFEKETIFNNLKSGLENFPAEFLMFAGHVKELEFEIPELFFRRSISCERPSEDEFESIDDIDFRKIKIDEGGGRIKEWLLAERKEVAITTSAGEDGNQLQRNRRRDKVTNQLLPVPISWAVPLSRTLQRGAFWIFFPTDDQSSQKGIMNAPWDTNNERTQVLGTDYNKFLLSQFSELIVKSIPVLVALFPEDKGQYLDFLPARGAEEPSRASFLLVEEIKKAMSNHETLLDLDGVLRKPSSMRKIPSEMASMKSEGELAPSSILKHWASIDGTPRNLPHWSIIDPGGNRIAGYNRYLDASDNPAAAKPGDLVTWLEAALTKSTIENSIEAVRLIRDLLTIANFELALRVKEARIVLCNSGALAAPTPGVLFYSDRGVKNPELSIVDHELIKNHMVREFLIEQCGITEAEGAAELDVVLANWPAKPDENDWRRFWLAAEKLTEEQFTDVFGRHSIQTLIKALSVAGTFENLSDLFLEGRIFQKGEGDDIRILDTSFHHATLGILRNLEVGETPKMTSAHIDFRRADDYKVFLKSSFPADKPSPSKIKQIFEVAPIVPLNFEILEHIGMLANARYTTWVLENCRENLTWLPVGATQPIDSPALWYVKLFGLLETSLGPRKFNESLSKSMEVFKRVAPVSILNDDLTRGCGLCPSFAELSAEALKEIVKKLSDVVDYQLIGDCLGVICRHLPEVPKEIPARVRHSVQMLAPDQVTAVSDNDEFERISGVGIPAIFANSPESANELASRWGVKASESIQQEFEPISPSEPELLADLFFLLGEIFPRQIASISVVRCTSLINVIQTPEGQVRRPVDQALHKKTLYVVLGSHEDNSKILKAADELLHLNLTRDQYQTIQENAVTVAINEKTKAIRRANTEIEKVLAIFSTDQVKSALPKKLLEQIGGEINSPEVLAEMLLAVHGPQLLEKTKNLLHENGLRPPTQWAGSKAAIKFVTELGFDRPFAGFKEPDRAAHTEVQGKIDLGDLHPYQIQLKDDVKSFIDRDRKDPRWRALLYLPTGAGKTRVTVQGILELINEGKLGKGPVLWIAQSYELCEQAVQTFTEIWSSIGTAGALSVDRLWNDKSVEEASIPSEFAGQIVVAVDAKIESAAIDNKDYEWLQKASLVVIDEAHKATSRRYTTILRWLRTGVKLSKKDEFDQRPILGLTATPNQSGVEKRFGPTMIRISEEISGGLSDVEFLRGIGVLAIPSHQLLEGVDVGGTELGPDGGELDEVDPSEDEEIADPTTITKPVRKPIWLPTAMEESLADNQKRNAEIIESIRNLDPTWPVIVFALSVSHAQLLAALLVKNGVKSAAVSGETSPSLRKLHISDFRNGKIQVLTNYGVLTTGFDAPKVRAIYITRPTFSKNLYLQMIGRGLRGPLNGGTQDCLIVDIADNFESMDIKHIYEEMGAWWSAGDTSE
jgi:superfamily II DNA or RNA helicase